MPFIAANATRRNLSQEETHPAWILASSMASASFSSLLFTYAAWRAASPSAPHRSQGRAQQLRRNPGLAAHYTQIGQHTTQFGQHNADSTTAQQTEAGTRTCISSMAILRSSAAFEFFAPSASFSFARSACARQTSQQLRAPTRKGKRTARGCIAGGADLELLLRVLELAVDVLA